MVEFACVEVGGRELPAAKRAVGLPQVRNCGLGVGWVSVADGVMRLSMLWLEGAVGLRLGVVAAGQGLSLSVPVDLALLRPVLRAVRARDVMTWRVDDTGVSVSVQGRGAGESVGSFLPALADRGERLVEPEPQAWCDGPSVVVASGKLSDAFTAAARAASRDTTLPVLCGVLLEGEGKRLHVASSDRYRLVSVSMAADSDAAGQSVQAIVPRWPALVLAAMTGPVRVWFPVGNDRRIVFATDTCTVHAQTIPGQFPRWQDLLRAAAGKAEHRFQVTDSSQLVKAAEAARKSAPVKASPVRLSVDPKEGKLRLVMINEADSSVVFEQSVQISANVWDGPDPVAVRPEYLRDCARVFPGRVNIHMGTPTQPVLLSEGDSSYVIMPVRLAP